MCRSVAAEVDPFVQFRNVFMEAARSNSIDRVLQLVHWEGVDESTKNLVAGSLADDLKRPIESVEIVPLLPDQTLEYTIGNTTFRPNLTPKRRLLLKFKDEGGPLSGASTAYLLGMLGNDVRIATAAPVPAPGK